jgi:hypothetical protein
LEPIGRLDELRGGTCVDAELIEDGEVFLGHGKVACAGRNVESQTGPSKVKIAEETTTAELPGKTKSQPGSHGLAF